MYHVGKISILFSLAFLLYGCLYNSVKSLPTGHSTSTTNSVVIYGVGLDSRWNAQKLLVDLKEYSLEKHAVIGNCWHFNRMEAVVSNTPSPVKYFAFEVPPAYYIHQFEAFEAPRNKIVYLGDFVLNKEKVVELRRNLDAEKETAIKKALPDIKESISLANKITVGAPLLFLCTP